MPARKSIAVTVVTAAVFFATYLLGKELVFAGGYSTPLWPATGVEIAAVILGGRAGLVGIYLGGLAGAIVAARLGIAPAGGPISTAAFALNCACEAFIATMTMQRVAARVGRAGRPIGLMAGGLVGGALDAAASLAVILANGSTPAHGIAIAWINWTIANATGAVIVMPVALRIGAILKQGRRARPPRDIAALVLRAIVPLALCVVVFFAISQGPLPVVTAFVLFPLMLLIAVELGPPASEMFVLVAAIVCLQVTSNGRGPFHSDDWRDELVNLQLFLGALGITAQFLPIIRAGGGRRLPAAVLLAGWTMAAGAAFLIDEHKRALDVVTLEAHVEAGDAALIARFDDYVGGLRRPLRFLIDGSPLTEESWRVFAAAIAHDPGLQAGGFLEASGKPLALPGMRDPTAGAGSDERQASRIMRRIETAAAESRDTGRDRLVFNGRDYVLLLPVFAPGASTWTETQRRGALRGWVYLSIDLGAFLRSVTTAPARIVALSVSDPARPAAAPLLPGEAADSTPDAVIRVDLGGYPLDFSWRRTSAYVSHRDFAAMGMGSATALLALAVVLIVVNLQSTRQRSIALANRMTRQLADRERLWKTLTESAPVGIFQTGIDGALTYANPRWHALAGSAPGAGGDWMATVHRDDRPAVRRAWSCLASGLPFDAQFRTARAGETATWITCCIAPTFDAFGRISGYLGTAQDISDIKRQERDLIASSKMSSLGEMAGGIAHEVNNPLMIIQAHADTIRRLADRGQLDATKARGAAQQIEDTVRRIAKIITGLRAFARNADRDPMAPASVGQIVDATLGLCQQRFRANGVEVITAGALNAQLDCRAVQLSQVLLNLLNNAYDAIERLDDKWIELKVEDRPSEIVISVTDSGQGITPEVAGKMMQPFFTTKPVGKGTGLGLSISKGIVEDHGGTIELDCSSPHTRFNVTIPKTGGGAEA